MNELRKLVNISLGPRTQDKSFIMLRCYCEFEGHGRASETWNLKWELMFPQTPHHYKNSSGTWTIGNPLKPLTLHAGNYDAVMKKAKSFFEWYILE